MEDELPFDRCRLNLLGGFLLQDRHGRDLPLPTRKDRLLLCYLALNAGKRQPREKICGLLWADRSEEQARGSLRQSLSALRQAFADTDAQVICSDRASIWLEEAALAVDVLAFQTFAVMPGRISDAVALYGGELLQGHDAPTPEANDWLRVERQRLSNLAVRLVENCSLRDEAPGDPALGLARRLLQGDRLLEPVSRALMRMLWRRRHRTEALRVYAECRTALADELGVAPEFDTEQLYLDILTDSSPVTFPSAGSDHAPPDARPSLAVMPFTNIGKVPELDVLCEGLAEDIITGLGRFHLLFVIDRNSSLAVSQITNDSFEIGKRLGVELVVTGSLRRLGDRVRLTVQLVRAQSRAQVWSESFDSDMADLLTVPDTIIRSIVMALHAHVETTLEEQSRRKPALAAYECLLRGVKHLRSYGPDENDAAIVLFDKAIALDPGYALAHAYRAFADVVAHGYDDAPAEVLLKARDLGQLAVDMEPDNARSHWLLGVTCAYCGDPVAEERQYRKAIALNPNDANVIAALGYRAAENGNPDKGVELIREAMRLNPHHPEWYWLELGNIFYMCRRFQDAIEAFRQLTRPTVWVHARLAACHAELGHMEDAQLAADQVRRMVPDFKLPDDRKQYLGAHDMARYRNGMRKAGLKS